MIVQNLSWVLCGMCGKMSLWQFSWTWTEIHHGQGVATKPKIVIFWWSLTPQRIGKNDQITNLIYAKCGSLHKDIFVQNIKNIGWSWPNNGKKKKKNCVGTRSRIWRHSLCDGIYSSSLLELQESRSLGIWCFLVSKKCLPSWPVALFLWQSNDITSKKRCQGHREHLSKPSEVLNITSVSVLYCTIPGCTSSHEPACHRRSYAAMYLLT